MAIGLFLATVALGTAQLDEESLAMMAASEFVGVGTRDDLAWMKPYHAKALPYFRSRPAADLRRDLDPVYRQHRFNSMEACGAAYVMAL
ncbi:MAG: hypothetical protein ACHQ50_17490, partial [Fimbriimonadales bacterium]